jgi:hypothetical protein
MPAIRAAIRTAACCALGGPCHPSQPPSGDATGNDVRPDAAENKSEAGGYVTERLLQQG